MNFFAAAFSEVNGSPSSTRLLAGVVVVGWLAIFVKAGFALNSFPPVTPEQVGVLAVAFGAKVWQKGRENGKQATGNTETFTKTQ